MNLSAIFSKTGKGVQEASGKTSHLSRADRAVLAAVDGKTNVGEVAKKFDKIPADKLYALINLLDKDGFIREISTGSPAATPTARPAAPSVKAPPAKLLSGGDSDAGLDFTQALKLPPKAPAAPKPPTVDIAAATRADAERKAQEDLTLDYRSRQELQAKLKAEADATAKADARARAEAEVRARVAVEEKAAAEARAAAEAKNRADAEAMATAQVQARMRAEAEAKVKAAREAAVRMATEAKARAEAEAKTKTDAAEREKAELNVKLDAERKAREDAERRATEAADGARRELEEKAKRDAEEMRRRLEAEMNAKLDAERKLRDEEDRKRREEEDRKRKEEDERRAKEEAEWRAKGEAERKKRDEEERKRKEEDELRRKEEDARRAKDDAERKSREEIDRQRREEEDRRRNEEDERRRKEDGERRAKDDAERKAKEDAERKTKDDATRRGQEEAEAKARTAAEAAASRPRIETVAPPPAAATPPAGGMDDLLGDLANFGKREEEERAANEEAERQAKAAAARKAKEEAERRAKDEAERKAREEVESRAKEEAERKAREEAERTAREEEERLKREAAERKQKAKEAKQAAERGAKAAAGKAVAKHGNDVEAVDEDFDVDEIKRDQKALARREQPLSAVVAATGRPRRWGKTVAIVMFALLVGGIGVLHVMPLSTVDFEKGASEALGLPVKIGAARLSLITGIELKFENVAIGDAVKIRFVRGAPEIGALFGERKAFSRVELEGVSMGQAQVADALFGKAAGANFRVARVVIKQLNLDGPLKLPPLDVDAAVSGDGSLQSVRLTGADKLSVQLSPRGGELAFEINAGSLALPFVPALTLSEFVMKGAANRSGVSSAEFDGRAFDGVIGGTARIRWGANWNVEGEVRARGVKVAVFAPALVSDGRIDGRATYTMSGDAPGRLYERARMQGEFRIDKGVLGSFDLTRALQTGGAQSTGRTVFNEMNGQGVYDKGAVQLRDITMTAGAMNAGASLDIDAGGGISGRIVVDVKTPNQTLRAVLNISGKLQDPVVRK